LVLLPVGAAIAAGAVVAMAPLAPAPRGLLTASVATLVYGAVVWWSGPEWLRATVLRELALAGRRLRLARA
jgi:hypothetical protein